MSTSRESLEKFAYHMRRFPSFNYLFSHQFTDVVQLLIDR